MPRPAKPPMTLREAKRAYKKDGGFRYTASQMARADRQDAREEQRKKAAEKERQRLENKRKRDEKLERERAVRQKMLEEGRITVEDTWGKVTASQPRLNRFFVQRPPIVPAKRSRDEAIQEDSGSENKPPTQEHRDEAGNAGGEGSVQLAEESASIASPVHATDVDDRASPTQNLSASLPSPSGILHQPGRTSKSRGEEERLHMHMRSQPRALQEIGNSELNARYSQRHRPSQMIRGEENPSCSVLDFEQNSRYTQVRHAPPENVLTPPRNSAAAKSLPYTTSRLARESYQADCEFSSQKACNGLPGSHGGLSKTNTQASSLDTDEEEDFTEGIDDETFLLLCAEQALSADSAREARITKTSGASASANSMGSQEQSRSDPNPPVEALDSKAPTVYESFSAVFNEIEEKDLIALAEEVEASTPAPSDPGITPKSATAKSPLRLRTQPVPISNRKILSSEESKRKKGRDHLWGDFGAPGPATQAVMLELVVEAEATTGG